MIIHISEKIRNVPNMLKHYRLRITSLNKSFGVYMMGRTENIV